MVTLDAQILASLNTIGDTTNLLLCSICLPCADVSGESVLITNARRQARLQQDNKAKLQKEIDDLADLIVTLSDTTEAANMKSTNAQLVIDSQADYDSFTTQVEAAQKNLEIAKQTLEAYRNPAQLALLQSQQRTRLTPLLSAATAQCTAATTKHTGY